MHPVENSEEIPVKISDKFCKWIPIRISEIISRRISEGTHRNSPRKNLVEVHEGTSDGIPG